MHSWIFRNRRRLEAIYEGAGRRPAPPSVLPAPARPAARRAAGERPRLCVVELIPRSRRAAA